MAGVRFVISSVGAAQPRATILQFGLPQGFTFIRVNRQFMDVMSSHAPKYQGLRFHNKSPVLQRSTYTRDQNLTHYAEGSMNSNDEYRH